MATTYCNGGANGRKKIITIPVSGTWVSGDTATVECGNIQVISTVGDAVTPADVAQLIVNSCNATTPTENLGTGESRNRGGYQTGQFRDFVASRSGNNVVLTGYADGVDFTVTASDTSTSGVFTTPSTTQTATGPNDFGNADNFGGSLPSVGDTVVFDRGSPSITMGLANSINDLSLDVRDDYPGLIGRPRICTNHPTFPYPDYRANRFLTLQNSGSGTQIFKLGNNTGVAAFLLYLDLGTTGSGTQTIYINNAAAENAVTGKAIEVVGGKALDITAFKGSASFGEHPDENLSEITFLRTMKQALASDADILIGPNATLTDNEYNCVVRDGTITLGVDCTGSTAKARVYGGNLVVLPEVDINKLIMYGGYCDFQGADLNFLVGYGGEFDATKCKSATGNVGPFELHRGFTYRDPNNSLLADLSFFGCGPQDCTLELGYNLQMVITAASSCEII